MTPASADKPSPSHTIEVRVRYAECDAMGYLYHGRYWVFFEIARTELLRSRGIRYRDLEEQGVFFVVYKCASRYLRPIRYDDLLTISVAVGRITPTRVDHTYAIHKGDELCTEATTTLACVGPDGRPAVMPDALWASHQAG